MKPTRKQLFAFGAAWAGWVLDAFDFTIFLLVMPQIAKDFGVQHTATAGSIALTLLARLVGGYLAGAAADRWGRKLPLLISVIWFALCDGAVAIAPSFGMILVLRTLFGLGMGAEWTSGTTLAMESMPKKYRGIASGILQGSWAIGYLLAAGVSALVLPHYGWRAMFVIAALPALLAIPMRFWVDDTKEETSEKPISMREAMKREPLLLKKIVWGSAITAAGFGAYYAISGLYPTILKVEHGLDAGGVAMLVALFNVGMLIGSAAVGFLASKRGVMIAIAIPCALAIPILPIYTGSVAGLLGIGAFLGGAVGTAMCGATPLVLTELFPASVRARCTGLVYHIGAFFAAFVPMTIAASAEKFHTSLARATTVMAAICELAVVLLVVSSAKKVIVAAAAPAAAFLLFFNTNGCLRSNIQPGADGGTQSATVEGDDPTDNPGNVDKLTYRDLATHPGCSTAGLTTRKASSYTPADIPGYKCAAKAYPVKTPEDTKKPIILLVHGNSSTPADWEKFPADTGLPMLSERMSDLGYRVLAVDMRFDLVDDPKGNNATENAGQNFDHGWGVPIVQHFIDSVLSAYPDRQISIVSFSVAPTMVRDALRRLHREGKKPFERVQDLVYCSGGHHGVSSFRALCNTNPTMRGKVACELGDRTSYQPTDMAIPNNGPDGAWEVPCADGDSAYGQKGVCGNHKVSYTTLVMQDVKEGTYQDEFVSEGAAMLKGADNKTVSLADNDLSNYFYNGLFKNHYGAIRSEAALTILTKTLTD